MEQGSPAQWAEDEGAPFAVLDATTGEVLASVGFVRLAARDGLAGIGYWCAPWARGRA